MQAYPRRVEHFSHHASASGQHPRHSVFDGRFFHLRQRSILRASLVVWLSLVAALLLSHFPQNHATLLLIIPAVLATLGTVDTVRCMQVRWNFYHVGVVLCIYMDLMVLGMIYFFLIYPFLI